MKATQPDYFGAYRSLKLTRDAQGVLIVEFHTNGGPLTFTAQDHTDFVDAFYRIAQDRENKIVILTGAGGELLPGIDFSTFGNVADPDVWSQVHHEGVQILENLANIRVPVIAAVEGSVNVHSEYALLASVIVAGKSATFNDLPHFWVAWYRAMEFSRPGVTGWVPAARKHFSSTPSRSRLRLPMNGERSLRSYPTARRSYARENWPRCT